MGDGDSQPKELKERYADIVHVVKEQEFNDMTKATRFCKNRGPRIAYLGATGKREDHTVGNIFLLPFYLEEEHVEPVMFTDHGVFIPAKGTRTFASYAKQQVSIFNISCTKLSSENLRWQSYAYKQLWQGTLNEAVGTTFTMKGDGVYMMFLNYQ